MLNIYPSNLKYRNIIIYLGAMLLSNAFGNPNDITTLLFLQFQITVEYSKMELLKECMDVQTNLHTEI